VILVIDNYDSFTFNLVEMLRRLGHECLVIRNDEIEFEEVERMVKEKAIKSIVISPGPGKPSDSTLSKNIVNKLYKDISIIGICLGHQIIAENFGIEVNRSKKLMHGKLVEIHHDNKGVFNGLEQAFKGTRYNSLTVEDFDNHSELEVAARSCHGEVMGIRHRHFPLVGIQFHPESYSSEFGEEIFENFLGKKASA
jgi:para-aminobenzoate synthetase component 2